MLLFVAFNKQKIEFCIIFTKFSAFVGADNSPIARCADPAFVLLDDKMLDDRNLTANYFYARVLITFEYLMDLVLEKD